MGLKSAEKLLEQLAGSKSYHEYRTTSKYLMIIASVLGPLYGVVVLTSYSMMITMIGPMAIAGIILIIALAFLDFLLVPHWSHDINN